MRFSTDECRSIFVTGLGNTSSTIFISKKSIHTPQSPAPCRAFSLVKTEKWPTIPFGTFWLHLAYKIYLVAERTKYFAKDPKIKQAFKNATWLSLFLIVIVALAVELYLQYQNEVDSTNGYVIGITLLAAILFIFQSLLTWFAHWLPRVSDPDQFYDKVFKLPGYKKIYNSYKSLHPLPTHYTPENIPIYNLPIEIRYSRIGVVFAFVFCLVISIFLVGIAVITTVGYIQDGERKSNLLACAITYFSVFLLSYASYSVFKKLKDRSIKLKFSDIAIEFGGKVYPWKEIISYEIENRSSGRSSSQYLVLTMMDSTKPEILINMLEIWPGQVDQLMDTFMLKVNG
jgi:hypothetical protein